MNKHSLSFIYFLLALSIFSVTGMISDVISPIVCIEMHLLLLGGIIVMDFIGSRRISLLQIWVFGFIYILWSEMMLICVGSNVASYVNSFTFLLLANDILLIGYYFYSPKKIIHHQTRWILTNKRSFFLLTFVILFFFLFFNYDRLINSIYGGRQLSSVLHRSINLGKVFTNAGGLMVAAMAAFYYKWNSKRSVWISIIFLIPVFLFQLLLGTRFRLIYVLLPWLVLTGILNVKLMSKKNIMIVLVIAVVMGIVSDIVKRYRTLTLSELITMIDYDDNKDYSNGFAELASKMSPEGCVYMTRLAETYYSNHKHEYGKEIGFMFYWVIPRAIWKDKPTPIDHWLIREYQVVEDTYSTASAFTGEIRADFGYWCLIIVFFWGWILRYADGYIINAFSDDGPYLNKLFASLIYPCVFFYVRSPLTSTQSFMVEIIIYLAIRHFMGRKIPQQSV